MRTSNIRTAALLLLVAALTVGCAHEGTMSTRSSSSMSPTTSGSMTMDGWHPAAQEAARFMMDKYGEPDEMTESMMVWGKTGPWKRTIVYRDAVDHNFPMPHPDVMEQFIDFEVPEEMYDELAMYDGSVIVERTKGEISARCDKEAANFLALNLAHEIMMGERTVEQARMKYGQEIKAAKSGNPTSYTQGLMFDPMSDSRANDPDQALPEM